MIAAGALAAGCYSAGDGSSPPGERIYFPVGLALTTDARELAVANSDFDLQYNAGTLALLDLERLRALLPQPCSNDEQCAPRVCDTEPRASNEFEPGFVCVDGDAANRADPCGSLGSRAPQDQLLYPGRCNYIEIDSERPPLLPSGEPSEPVLISHVEIGAFATDVVWSPRPSTLEPAENGSQGRLFIPVRGDATLHWADVTPDGIECGQGQAHGSCDDAHRAGNRPDQENTRDLRLAAEPFGVAVSPEMPIGGNPSASVVLVTNQTTGRVSLFGSDWTENQADAAVALEFEVTNLALRPMSAVALPPPRLSWVSGERYEPGFLVTFRNSAEINLIRYFADDEANPERPYASRASAVPITINTVGSDSRGIALDDATRRANERACAEAPEAQANLGADCLMRGVCTPIERASPALSAYVACLRNVASTPLDVFVASRAPASLLVGRTVPAQNALQSSELPAFYDSIPLTLGPSRVVTGRVIVGESAAGELEFEPRTFVSCFDSRRVFIYDPVRRRIDTEVRTGRGPHAMAVDEQHGLLFIGHFTDSFIGVVSLDRRFPRTYSKMLATVGEPSAPRASK